MRWPGSAINGSRGARRHVGEGHRRPLPRRKRPASAAPRPIVSAQGARRPAAFRRSSSIERSASAARQPTSFAGPKPLARHRPEPIRDKLNRRWAGQDDDPGQRRGGMTI
jgi:hypothetical protein